MKISESIGEQSLEAAVTAARFEAAANAAAILTDTAMVIDGVQATDNAGEASQSDKKKPRGNRLKNAHWLAKVSIGVLLFGGMSYGVGRALVDRIVERQKPLLTDAQHDMQKGFEKKFDKGACEIQKKIAEQGAEMTNKVQGTAVEEFDKFKKQIFESLGLKLPETPDTIPPVTVVTQTAPPPQDESQPQPAC